MSEMMNNKISEEQLNKVAGGNDGMGEGAFSAYDISPRWVRVTASELNCRYWPNGEIAKTYERGHRLKVDGITTDGKWYRLTGFGSTIRRAASATATFTKTIQSWINTLKTYIIDVS